MTTALLDDASISASLRRPAIRVLHLINGEHYAGAERVQDLLAQCLAERGFEVSFACVKPRAFPQARRARHAPLFAMPMRSKLDLRPARHVARLIQQEGFALLHTHTPRTALIGRLAALWTGVPMIHHVHGHTASEVGGGWRHRFHAWVERRSLAGVAKIIAVSPSSASYMLRQGVPHDQIAVVPNGIAATALNERAPPSGRWTLGIVGLFRPRKGLEDLLRAVALLRRQGRDVMLRAVGSFETPAYEADMRRLAVALGVENVVEWRGFRSDVAAELQAMDLFLFPSILPEGMPMVVLEAMGAGVPVIGASVEGVTDVIRDGRDGLLVPPGDPAQLAAAVSRVMASPDLWLELRSTAHARQASRFSDRSMSAGVAAVYRAVLGR